MKVVQGGRVQGTYVCKGLGKTDTVNPVSTRRGEDKHRPSYWIRSDAAQALIAEIANCADLHGLAPINSVEGRNGGTFACKELVVAYASWISAADGTQPTMSSLQIADLTGKSHRNVLRDIRTMLKSLGIPEEGLLSFEHTPQNGQKYQVFHLPPDLTLTLVSGYDIPLRHRVVTGARRVRDYSLDLGN